MTTPRSHLQLSEASGADDGWSLFAAGDCVYAGTEPGVSPIGDGLRSRITAADVSVVNLEAPVPAGGETIPKTGPIKSSAPETPEMLARAGVDAVTLANNHAMDHGERGLRETIRSCAEAGIATVGAGEDEREAMAPHRFTVDGVDVALLAMCEREFGVAEEDQPGTAWIGHPDAPDAVESLADECDVVCVFAHGGIEFVPLPPVRRRTQLREFAEAGADLVVGHHPHVPQGWEVHEGTPIFYSLGNFLFGRGAKRPKTQWGLALEIDFQGTTPSGVQLVPTEQREGTVGEFEGEQRIDEHLAYLYRLADLTADEQALEAHWQELAVRLFHQRYSGWLREASGGNLINLLRNPGRHLARDGLWDPAYREREMLILLNLVRNESHRSVIETALEVRTGLTTDRRTPQVEETVRDLVAWTEDQPIYDRPSTARRVLETLIDKLSPAPLGRSPNDTRP